MADFLLVTWWGGGNVEPQVAIARRLVARGHRLRVLGSARLAPRFAGEGIGFTARDPDREWDLEGTARAVVEASEAGPTDAVLVDFMQLGAVCGAEATGLPSAALVHTLYGALHDDGDIGVMGMAGSVDDVNAARAALGLPPVRRLVRMLDRLTQVLLLFPMELDVQLGVLPNNVHYIGPVLDPDPAPTDWTPPHGQPLVVVSFGSTPLDEVPVLERVLAALAGLPVSVLATVGDHVDPAAVAAPPGTTVTGYLPHARVLPHASVFVTHAGLGSVTVALAHGVPMVCMPLEREQPQNAAAVARVGAGLTLAKDASVADVSAAVTTVLDDERYRAAAQGIAVHLDPTGGRCIDALERLARG